MDGGNNGKPYFLMDDLGGFTAPIFGNTHMLFNSWQAKEVSRVTFLITSFCKALRNGNSGVKTPTSLRIKTKTKRSPDPFPKMVKLRWSKPESFREENKKYIKIQPPSQTQIIWQDMWYIVMLSWKLHGYTLFCPREWEHFANLEATLK